MSTFSIRIVNLDSYMCSPIQGLDVMYSDFRGHSVNQVPILRLFGSTATGEKICVHIHGVFPYMYIPYDGTQEVNSLMYQIAGNIDKAVNIALNQASSNCQHVYKICLVSGIPMYGYHNTKHQFLKIYLYNPLLIRKVSDLLMNESTLGKFYQPHETHLNFTLQFMMDYNLHGMSNMLLSRMKFRVNPDREDSNIDPDLYLPLTVSKATVCELEGDAFAEDIVNREEIASGNIAANPGIAALWADEMQRRRNKGEISQIEHLLELKNVNVEPTESHFAFREALRERLTVLSSDRNVVDKMNASVYPAETPSDTNIQNASVINLQTPSLDDITLTPTSSLDDTLLHTQVSDGDQTFDEDALRLLDILTELGENAKEPIEDDSILTQVVKGDEDDLEDDKDVDMSMPLEVGTTPKKIVPPENDSGSDDDIWNTTLIPQLDGQSGDCFQQFSKRPYFLRSYKNNLENVNRTVEVKENTKLKVKKKATYINKAVFVKCVDESSKFWKSMPVIDDDWTPDETVINAASSDKITNTSSCQNSNVVSRKKTAISKKTLGDCSRSQKFILKTKRRPSKCYNIKTAASIKKMPRKSPELKTKEELKRLENKIKRIDRRNQLVAMMRKLHQKEHELIVVLSKTCRPHFRVISKDQQNPPYALKRPRNVENLTKVKIISDIILQRANYVDPNLHLTVKYPNNSCFLFNYNRHIFPEKINIPTELCFTKNETQLESYIKEKIANSGVSYNDQCTPIKKYMRISSSTNVNLKKKTSSVCVKTKKKSKQVDDDLQRYDDENIGEYKDNDFHPFIFSSKYLRAVNDAHLLKDTSTMTTKQLRKSVENVTQQLMKHIKYLKTSLSSDNNHNLYFSSLDERFQTLNDIKCLRSAQEENKTFCEDLDKDVHFCSQHDFSEIKNTKSTKILNLIDERQLTDSVMKYSGLDNTLEDNKINSDHIIKLHGILKCTENRNIEVSGAVIHSDIHGSIYSQNNRDPKNNADQSKHIENFSPLEDLDSRLVELKKSSDKRAEKHKNEDLINIAKTDSQNKETTIPKILRKSIYYLSLDGSKDEDNNINTSGKSKTDSVIETIVKTHKRTSERLLRRKCKLSLDDARNTNSSTEELTSSKQKKRAKTLSELESPKYSSLPISIVSSPKSSKSSKGSASIQPESISSVNKISKKETTALARKQKEQQICDNAKRTLNFSEHSSLHSTITEEKLSCALSSRTRTKRIIDNRSNKPARDTENYEFSSKSRANSNSSSIFSSRSESEYEQSFFNPPEIVNNLTSELTTAEKYDKAANYNAYEGTSRIFPANLQEKMRNISESSSCGTLTPHEPTKSRLSVTTEENMENSDMFSSGSIETTPKISKNFCAPETPMQISNIHEKATSFSENSSYGTITPYQHSEQDKPKLSVVNKENIEKIPVIVNSNKPEFEFVTIEPLKKAPSRKDAIKSLDTYKIAHIKQELPFYSNVEDVTGNMEVGYNVLKINSKTTADLPDFESQVDSLNNIRKANLEALSSNLQWNKTNIKNVMLSYCSDRDCIIIPVKKPPTVKMVENWIKEKSEKNVTPEKAVEKVKIRIPLSPGFNGNDDEMNLSLTLSPCTPSTIQSNMTQNTVPNTPKSSQTSIPVSGTECSQKEKDIRNKIPQKSVKNPLELTQDSSLNKSCQITGVSVNNTYGFDKSTENLKDARAVYEYQHLTLLVMELHTCTRGDFKPDPYYDSVRAIFYSILNDVPDNHQKARTCKGVIAVRCLPLRSDTGKMELLSGIGVDCDITYVESEKSLIEEFIKLMNHWDPDIIAGYEIELLSWGYLIARASAIGMNLKPLLGRTKVTNLRWKDEGGPDELRIIGRIVLDVWRLMRHEISLQSYTFESIVYHILHKRVAHYTFKDLSFWWEHKSNLYRHRTVRYYLFRVLTILELFEKLDLIGRTSELARLFGIQFYEVLSRGSQFRVESMMLRLAKPLNFIPVSPSIQQRAHMKAPEYIALVLEPESKLYNDPVIVLDFQSLYPSLIIAYNYCFTTCIGRVKNLGKSGPFDFGATQLKMSRRRLMKLLEKDRLNFAPCGVGFVKQQVRDGILPRMLREILDTRLMVKNAMKENKNDHVLQKVLHNRQLGLKLIANVTYGYTAANFSGRMSLVEVADSVVSKGRETLQRAIKMVDNTPEWGARVVYGDTDSLFVTVPGKSREHAFHVGKQIADAVTKANPDPVKLKLEKVYQPCILQTKKRYVGYMYETPDQKEPVYEAKGIETVRRDGCPAVSKMLEKCLRLLFEKKDVSLVKKYVLRQFNKIQAGRASIQDLTFAKEYRGAAGYRQGACVPALELTRRWTSVDKRNEPRSGERVPYIIVNGPPGLPLIRLVRSPRELLNDPSLRPNALYYITRVIIPPINRCFNLIGADLHVWFNQMPRKQFKYLPRSVSPEKRSTIAQYFSTNSCVVCGEQTRIGICLNCSCKPQITTIILMEKLRLWERNFQNSVLICQSCTSSSQTEVKCVSLDCPVLYRRVQTDRDVQQATYIRELLSSSDFLV